MENGNSKESEAIPLDRSKDLNGDQLIQENTKMLKQNGDPEDGDGEKLILEESKIGGTNKNATEVKFISADSQNGDAKIDIEQVKIAFAGMGKEELMKFANDPFWIRMRWVLFIFFWALWAAMLAGAVAIVVMAPKCAAPAPLKWYEESPVYQVFVPSFKGEEGGPGNLKGLQSKLDYIKSLGVQGVIISSIFKSSDPEGDAVEDFKTVDARYGTLQDLLKLISTMKEKGLRLLMNLVPNHSSKLHEWFIKSEMREEPYTNYYVWAPSPRLDESGDPTPPNNWMSIVNGSAWEWSPVRKEFYLHQFGKHQPDLNFHNQDVIDEFQDILKFWIEHGATGFQLEKVQYLTEDPEWKNETVRARVVDGTIHDQYDFYNHGRTSNRPEVARVLAQWGAAVRNQTDREEVVLAVLGGTERGGAEMLQDPGLFAGLRSGFTAAELGGRVQWRLDNSVIRPTWQLGSWGISRVATRLGPEYVDPLNMLGLLLPGTLVTYYGEELGMTDPSQGPMAWDNSTAGETNLEAQLKAAESHLKVYRDVSAARISPSIMYGSFNMSLLHNDTVLTYTRLKSGNPGYLVAFNAASDDVTVDFTPLANVSDVLTVIARSTDYQSEDVAPKGKLSSKAVPMSPLSSLVLTFVPKTE